MPELLCSASLFRKLFDLLCSIALFFGDPIPLAKKWRPNQQQGGPDANPPPFFLVFFRGVFVGQRCTGRQARRSPILIAVWGPESPLLASSLVAQPIRGQRQNAENHNVNKTDINQ